ncbi:MAG: hypothetical protein US94_C0001G0066 [Berkelbacteria bacterium GW2011_GWB1_38_5]|nr:MAG: hypothetical protein US94_C0001G0066 [Berkelbacteria bacterium GW2011_GWB1_38_5]
MFWTILIVSFIFFSALIVLKANGYQLNYKNWNLTKTGMILLDGTPNDALIRVNNKTFTNGFPLKLSNLALARYDINVSKDGYNSWQKDILVNPGMAIAYRDIVLFLQNPKELNNNNLTSEEIIQEAGDLTSNIKTNKTEIFIDERIITRFSTNILAAYYYPDKQHIIVQIEKENNQNQTELRVIDIDGSNNQYLFDLASKSPAPITFRKNGEELYYIEADLVKSKTIR